MERVESNVLKWFEHMEGVVGERLIKKMKWVIRGEGDRREDGGRK